MAKIAIMGYGTVGSGVFEVITKNADTVEYNAGEPVEIKHVLDLRDAKGDPAQDLITHDVEDIINDPEISVVVETMGGEEPAHTFVKRALEAGKSVCTSNKNLVELYGAELLKIAKENGVRFLFEAAVGGGIPIIRPLKDALTADKVDFASGILNGTCNYILTEMSVKGTDFESALKDAQEKGFAERNPEADIEGYDSCRKIAILASIISKKNVSFEDIYTEGISKISAVDFSYADKLGMKIKLLSSATYSDGKLKTITAPFLIDNKNKLFSIDDVINAVWIRGNAVGDLVFQGAGAGKLPTASAVAADVVDAIKNSNASYELLWNDEHLKVEPVENYSFKYFVRLRGDAKKNNQTISGLPDVRIVENEDVEDECGIITGLLSQGDFNIWMENADVINYIRITPDAEV